jgi:hypothetical protein
MVQTRQYHEAPKQRLSDTKEINFKRENGVGFIVQKNIKEMVL